MIIYGTTNAGKVDEVPGGMFHVVTQFGHLYYIPLIPTGSYLVFEKTSDGFRGMSIPLSMKSILAGWARGFCWATILFCGFQIGGAFFGKRAGPNDWIVPLIGATLAAILLWLSYIVFRRARYERAIQLAKLAGYDDVGLLMIEVAYGKMTAAEADLELERREQQVAATGTLATGTWGGPA